MCGTGIRQDAWAAWPPRPSPFMAVLNTVPVMVQYCTVVYMRMRYEHAMGQSEAAMSDACPHSSLAAQGCRAFS